MSSTLPVEVEAVRLDLIDPGPNDRTTFDADALTELAASIAEVGLLQPVTVRPVGNRYEIVAGERRWRAHRLLGAETIDALVRDLDDRQAADAMIVENLSRADLNPMEEAEAYRSRIDRFGMTVDELAATAGVDATRVRRRLELLNLVPEAMELLRAGQLNREYAWRMSRLDVNRQRLVLAALARDGRMSWEDVKGLCDRLAFEQAQDVMFDVDVFLQVEEYVAEVRAARRGPRTLIAELVALVEGALDEALTEDETALVAEARAWLEGGR
jgi:ParB family chromosome partitioning protein